MQLYPYSQLKGQIVFEGNRFVAGALSEPAIFRRVRGEGAKPHCNNGQ